MKKLNVIDESNKILRSVSKEVVFPFKKEYIEIINDMIKFLEYSQIEELAKKYNLRPGMGLAAIQLGIKERFFVIVEELEDKTFKNYIVINPKIISHSEEMIYADSGEGCLSVNRETEGIVPRYARITVSAKDINGDNVTFRVREEISIAFQHEIDHLNGILFVDKIDKKNPFKNSNKMRGI